MKRNERGITLIALIITVIVLLILAGTAVSIAINGGDIFTRANEAKTSWNSKVSTEESEINNALAILDQILPSTTSEEDEVDLPAGWVQAKLSATQPYVAETINNVEVKAPIPAGYVASSYQGTGDNHAGREDQISTGLVIYEGTDAVDSTSHETALATRNQYVWIPVTDINDMVMCTKSGTAGISDSTKTACDVKIDSTTGKIYCATHMNLETEAENKESETYLCGKLYATSTGNNFTSGTANLTYNATSGLREPAVVTNNSSVNYLTEGTSYDGYKDSTTNETYHGYVSASAFLNEQKEQFYKMAKSVATYGGFYVGRYEAGYNGTTYTSTKGTAVANILNAGTHNAETNPAGVGNWYELYKKLAKNNTTTTSQMIWGCQYDQVMKFVDGKKDGQNGDYVVTTASSNRHHSSGKEATGNNTYDLVQNIYDLEGNFYEWTAEANGTNIRDDRGGYYYGSLSASYRGGNRPTTTNSNRSSRPGLFVNL